MIEYFVSWYKDKFSDPHAITLFVMLILGGLFIYFFSSVLMPVLVAIGIAFFLDLPVYKLQQTGLSRSLSTTVVVLIFVGVALVAVLGLLPLIWNQGTTLFSEGPTMLAKLKTFMMALPEKYPDFVQTEQIEAINATVNDKLLEWGQVMIQASLNSISNVVALIVYMILVPLMVFFFLKDKDELLTYFARFLPKERRLTSQVGDEMNQQIINYIRGKVMEIIIVGTISTITFAFLDLRYSVLLGVLVGFSVLVPFVGATVVTLPVALVALFQWGVSPEFGYVMIAYGIIQMLDGNVLVPILFSEAVNLHPVMIILAVIFFGGLWGLWGVFFAIPLATLVKAVLNAWPSSNHEPLSP